jgi:glycosyltransferase involved in cell wall biosynthesis
MSKFAIIIPTCDRPETLKKALASALAQKIPAHEIIIVDDGLKAIAVQEGARVIRTKGREGLSRARQIGVSSISTETDAITYVDDDDELLPNHVGLMSEALSDGTAFAFSKAIFRYPDGTETEDPEPKNHNPNKAYYNPTALLKQNIAPVSSFAHTRDAYEQVGGWDPTLLRMEDWDLWGRMFIAFGPPKLVNAVTNVVNKGGAINLTDANPLTYSMACSWRDIVADRLHYLAETARSPRITQTELDMFHIPRVGVIIPVYNAEKYLHQALDSMICQTYKDFEILAINDGSTDSSRRILQSYECRRFRLFDMSHNSGVTKTLNYGLLVSRSEYIARMDADDVSSPERLERQVAFLDENRNVGILGTRFLSMNESLSCTHWVNDVQTDPEEVAKELLDRCCIGHPTVMMRRRVVESIGGYDEGEGTKAVEDYELWLRAASRGIKIANLPYHLLKHREYDHQVSKRLDQVQRANFEKVREKYRILAK